MKYAVIKTGSKQYKVEEGQTVDVEKIPFKEGEKFNFKEVLLVVDESKSFIGQPFVGNCQLTAKVMSHKPGKKIRVAIYKAKSRYRKVKGHRQSLSQIIVESIKLKKKTPDH